MLLLARSARSAVINTDHHVLHLCVLFYSSIACSLIQKEKLNIAILIKRDFLKIVKINITQQEIPVFHNCEN